MRWGDQNLIPMCLSIATILKHTLPSIISSRLAGTALYTI